MDIDWRLAVSNALAALLDPINLYDRWPEYGYSTRTVGEQQPCTDRDGRRVEYNRLQTVSLGSAAIVQRTNEGLAGFMLSTPASEVNDNDRRAEFTLADLCDWIDDNLDDYQDQDQNWYIVTDRYIPKLRKMPDIRVDLVNLE